MLTDWLRAEVAAQRLTFDASQNAAAALLDELTAALHQRPASFTQRLQRRAPWLPLRTSPPAPRGLYLWGGVGRGKTLLMDLFVAELPAGVAVRMHFYHLMREVHAQLKAIKMHEDPLEQVARQLAERSRVLCLDEFFVADIADAMILAGLLAGLFRRGVTLVTTSNLPPRELYRDGLQRQRFLPAIDSIEEHLDIVHLDGGVDYRLRELEQAPTYLDAQLAATEQDLQKRFDTLAGGSVRGPRELTIEQRPLRARCSAPGMVWFEFSELCDGPRSQNDYIELARIFHTLFLSNVPRFDPFNENSARRFIMLIDELYDRGVKLVVSAAAAPTQLYHGERLRFEFERAASRLIEMQTQEYLAGRHRP